MGHGPLPPGSRIAGRAGDRRADLSSEAPFGFGGLRVGMAWRDGTRATEGIAGVPGERPGAELSVIPWV